MVVDGVSNPLVGDCVWYCGNNDGLNILSIGQKLPNGFGLYDMHGNVMEWAADWYGNSAPNGTKPWSANVDFNRMLRGGHLDDPPIYLRSSSIRAGTPTYSSGVIGFRLMRRVP